MVNVTARHFDGRLNGPFVLRGPRPYIDPMHNYYGAVGDGTANDTTPLQNALNDARGTLNGASAGQGAKVELPPGTYRITAKLIVPAAVSHQAGISLHGAGPHITQINAEVAGDAAIEFRGQKGYQAGGFRLLNTTGSRGSTVGIRFRGDTGTSGGTQTGSAIWRHLSVADFDRGLEIGSSDLNQAASEMRFEKLIVNTNNYGAWVENQNTLNIRFDDVEMNQNDWGIYATNSCALQAFGGHANGSIQADFYFQESGVYLIHGFRSEQANRLLSVSAPVTVAPVVVSLVGCQAKRSTNVDDILISGYGVTTLHMAGCLIHGKINYNTATTYGTGVGIYQSGIGENPPLGTPSMGRLKYEFKGVWAINKDTGYFEAAIPDDYGIGKPAGGLMSLAGQFEKAGAISDADFPTPPPPNGTQATDTTNNRRYVRVNGTWRYAALT